MPDAITITINGAPLTVSPATTVAAAIARAATDASSAAATAMSAPGSAAAAVPAQRAGESSAAGAPAVGASPAMTAGTGVTRRSVGGALRAPLCGMGVCQECRVTVNGRAHVLACQTLCRDGMQIETAQ